jgi:hypothetical protein
MQSAYAASIDALDTQTPEERLRALGIELRRRRPRSAITLRRSSPEICCSCRDNYRGSPAI